MSAAWPNTLRVQLIKRVDTGLGFNVRKAKEPPHLVVASLHPAGAAEESGLLQCGDRIVSVQGVNLEHRSFEDAVAILHEPAAGSCVNLLVRTPAGHVAHLETIFTPTGQPFSVRVTKSLNSPSIKNSTSDYDYQTHDREISEFSSSLDDDKIASADYMPPHFEGKDLPAQDLRFLLDENLNSQDTLHHRAAWPTGCEPHHCKGSKMIVPTPREQGTAREREAVLEHAKDFFEQYFKETKKSSAEHERRWQAVSESIEQRGTYHHTLDELTFGARTAWRNERRCIGRMYFNRLKVIDCREATTTKDMFEALCHQIEYSTNGGNIKAAITVFPPRTDGKHDFRIWNLQLIRFAGYRQSDGSVIGDPANVEFTEACQKLGWKGKGGMWDVLPLVLQANGGYPDYYEIPEDIVLRVQLHHPKYAAFSELGLQWYGLPAVSGMLFDCGGIEFPAVSFSGWYMSTEVGARDLCDVNRYNVTRSVAEKLGLDTSNIATLWQDQAMVEVNVAVLYSFQSQGVSMIDHHSASKLFLQHMRSEQKTRGGCPADWVWLVPPMSGSLCPVFHQEMLNYKLKPGYEYQDEPWKTFWEKRDAYDRMEKTSKSVETISDTGSLRYKTLREDPSRTPCTILYATETGHSENFARQLEELFKKAFIVRVVCMEDYDSDLEEETLLLVVTSTFGNGGPPENGEIFSNNLRSRERFTGDHPIRFAVFALGSSVYPRFCAFGKCIDTKLEHLGGERLYKCGEGDEMGSQEEDFKEWSEGVFQAATAIFNPNQSSKTSSVIKMMLQDEILPRDSAKATGDWLRWNFRLSPDTNSESSCNIPDGLARVHKKAVVPAALLSWTQLHDRKALAQICLAKLDIRFHQRELTFEPGDHLAIFPENPKELVDAVISHLDELPEDPEKTVICVEAMTESKLNGLTGMKQWRNTERLPPCTLHEALSYYLDLTSPPSRSFFKQLMSFARDEQQREQMLAFAEDTKAYEKWWQMVCPTLLDILEEFDSLKLTTSFLLTHLPLIKPRYYSISSSPDLHTTQLHLTVAIHRFWVTGQNGRGKWRNGLCTSWLNGLKQGVKIPCFIRKAYHFHLPKDMSLPIIMVGTGCGVAPFRAFWQHRQTFLYFNNNKLKPGIGTMTMYFGCRNPKLDCTYEAETREAEKNGSLTKVYRAYSRRPGKEKQYVQDIMRKKKKVPTATLR